MVNLPLHLKKIVEFLELLPGIGEKTANRLALYFLRLPQEKLSEFAQAVIQLKNKTKFCQQCFNLTEDELCGICNDSNRQKNRIMVVEDPLDIYSFEKGGIYQGLYHVLHGRIDPLNHIGPEEIKIPQLLDRIKKNKEIEEIIIATNPDLEGEATALYIKEKVGLLAKEEKREIKITRLGYGLPIGAEIEYADYMTLKKALDNRTNY